MPRLLILSSDTGEGHNSAARAISEAAETAGYQVSVRKPLEESGRLNRSLGRLYNFLLTHRPDWIGPYTSCVNYLKPYERDICYRRVSGYIRRFIEDERPDIVLSVHPMLNHLIQRWIAENGLEIPCYTFVTDPFPPFWKGWTSPYVQRYFVATEEAGAELARGGIPLQSIERVTMPLRAGFGPMTDTDVARMKTSLGVEGDLILVNGGARGGGPLRHLVRAVREAAPSSWVLVICGSNERIRKRLERIGDPRLLAFGFVSDIHRLVGAADLVITKPGALSTYETLASAVPAVLSAVGGLMPQESGLFDAARNRGFGFAVNTLDELRAVVRKGVSGWESRRQAIADFYRPDTGCTIVERIQLAHAGR
jgi:processive 1,2-diacylglycerol beta-glucosyltransferase